MLQKPWFLLISIQADWPLDGFLQQYENISIYDVKMQQDEKNIQIFNRIVGELVKEIRLKNSFVSMNKFAREFDFDRGNFSKLENGHVGCRLATIWKFTEANNIKFSEFAKILESRIPEGFTFIDN